MTITVVIELQVQPDKVEELKGTMKAIAPDARAYDGCQGVTVHQDRNNPNTVLLLEAWASRPHHEKYLAWRTETGVLAGVVAVLTAPPSIRYFDGVDA